MVLGFCSRISKLELSCLLDGVSSSVGLLMRCRAYDAHIFLSLVLFFL